MGRGRAKAKQTKVARELKYSSGALDAEALRRELAAQGPVGLTTTKTATTSGSSVDDGFEDAFSDDYGDIDSDDEDGED